MILNPQLHGVPLTPRLTIEPIARRLGADSAWLKFLCSRRGRAFRTYTHEHRPTWRRNSYLAQLKARKTMTHLEYLGSLAAGAAPSRDIAVSRTEYQDLITTGILSRIDDDFPLEAQLAAIVWRYSSPAVASDLCQNSSSSMRLCTRGSPCPAHAALNGNT